MSSLSGLGKYLFAFAMAGFAVIQFVTLSLPSEFMPLPANMPGKAVLACFTGLILLIGSVFIILNKKSKHGALLIGILFFLFLLYPHIPKLLTNLYNPGEWVALLETLCFSCGGFILANKLPADADNVLTWDNRIRKIALVSRYLFAVAIFIFGIQHIMYEKFIVTLIPEWIPAKQFWLYVVKIAFIATAVSIVINVQASLSTFLLGMMFLIWAIIVHAPRVMAKPNIEPEWTSLFVATAMSGICFTLSKRYGKEINKYKSETLAVATE